MVEAFTTAESIFEDKYTEKQYRDKPILFVVSDGLPTDPPDAGPERVRDVAKRLRDKGVVIISCYVTSNDSIDGRTLYATPQPEWDDAARLMFACASQISPYPFLQAQLNEFEWKTKNDAKLFCQINQSEHLSQFMQLAISDLQIDSQKENVRVFISYSHADERYVGNTKNDSLRSYLKGLENEGITFWWDGDISTGDLWDSKIKEELNKADIVLALVSQQFLNSDYINNVEVASFVRKRKEGGLRVIPVILSACDWKSHSWLSSTQSLPLNGENIEEHYHEPGKRKALYLRILKAVRLNASKVRQMG